MPIKDIRDIELCAYCADSIEQAFKLRKIAEDKTRTKCDNCGKLRWGARYAIERTRKNG